DIDHLCLALTCKSLLHHLDESATLQQLPKFRDCKALPAFPYDARLSANKRRTDRWRLLQRLENSYWRCCFGCFRLHPSHEFSSKDLKTPASKRTCIYGPLVGIVHLCPCMDMTFRDKRKLTKILSSPERRVEPYRIHDGFFEFFGSAGRHQCLHSYATETKTASLKCEVSLKLEECENFVVETKYTIADTKRPRMLFHDTMLPCPH
ncbi:hypothetical protein BGW36DRAFT_278426, partial [Talaromyces proteolyticus]